MKTNHLSHTTISLERRRANAGASLADRGASAVGASLLLGACISVVSAWTAVAGLNIPSDGSDGALVVSNDTVIDLSQAVTGNWDANNSANAGKGVYDAAKWAVVFKYSSVTINSNCTVTFMNHASRAPVVWLVSGDVTIDGAVDVSGQNYTAVPYIAEPGPGGFRGGSGIVGAGANQTSGFGPGGGQKCDGFMGKGGGGGSYGTVGVNGPVAYGNPSLIPLIGGSGGGGAANSSGGGAGGGGILIACASKLSVSGNLSAKGGNCANTSDWNDGERGWERRSNSARGL